MTEPTIYDNKVCNAVEFKPNRALSAYPIDGELRWKYGTFVEGVNGDAYIIGPMVRSSNGRGITPEYWCQVFPTTAGIATGFTDKNDVQIYTDDIIEFRVNNEDSVHQGIVTEIVEGIYVYVIEERGCMRRNYRLSNIIYDDNLTSPKTVRVVGTIHDRKARC